jgi:hypothetical protein
MDISYALEGYLIRYIWFDGDITTEPDSLEDYAKGNIERDEALGIHGRDQDGALYRRYVQCFEISLGHYDKYEDAEEEPQSEYDVRLLKIRCIPDKVLKAPLPPPDVRTRQRCCCKRETRFVHDHPWSPLTDF